MKDEKYIKYSTIIDFRRNLVNSFHSGNLYLDNFLKSRDATNNNICKTFIWVSKDGQDIIGYYSISVGALDISDDYSKYKAGGTFHILCFALGSEYQKQFQRTLKSGRNIYLGDYLFNDCFERIDEIRKSYAGASFITVNSTDDGINFYVRNGFEFLEDDFSFSSFPEEIICHRMYRPIDNEE